MRIRKTFFKVQQDPEDSSKYNKWTLDIPTLESYTGLKLFDKTEELSASNTSILFDGILSKPEDEGDLGFEIQVKKYNNAEVYVSLVVNLMYMGTTIKKTIFSRDYNNYNYLPSTVSIVSNVNENNAGFTILNTESTSCDRFDSGWVKASNGSYFYFVNNGTARMNLGFASKELSNGFIEFPTIQYKSSGNANFITLAPTFWPAINSFLIDCYDVILCPWATGNNANTLSHVFELNGKKYITLGWYNRTYEAQIAIPYNEKE